MTQPSTLQKAEIFRVDNPSTKVTCQFNPRDLSLSRSVSWRDQKVAGGNTPQKQFGGGEAQGLTVDLWFDATDTGTDVRNKYKALLTMAEIDTAKKDPKTQKGEPPQVKFQWGTYLSFTGVIKQISQNFVLFKGDGTPLRAKVQVSLSEVPVTQKSQNPTTRTESRKVWVVHEGQTLDWIAYQEYGDPACWRHIAETNGLANPMDLRPGQVLKLVPLP